MSNTISVFTLDVTKMSIESYQIDIIFLLVSNLRLKKKCDSLINEYRKNHLWKFDAMKDQSISESKLK